MTVCSSSFFFPVTRIWRSCNWLCALKPCDLMAWMISLALSPSRPCLIFNSCRAWPTDEFADDDFPQRFQVCAIVGDQNNLVRFRNDFGFCVFQIEAGSKLFARLVKR